MSKIGKILVILFCLILTFWGIPQTNKVLAADLGLCSSTSNGIFTTVEYTLENDNSQPKGRYPISGVIIREQADAIYFKLTGKLTKGKFYEAYIRKAGEPFNPSPDSDYSNSVVQFKNDNDTIELSITKASTPKLFNPTPGQDIHYKVNLLEGSTSDTFNKDAPLCRITNYKIGLPVNFTPCEIKLPKSDFGRGDSITALITNALLRTDYQIGYTSGSVTNESPKKVQIGPEGNGIFTFWANHDSLFDNVKVTIYTIIGEGEGAQIYSCSAPFNITNIPVSTTPDCQIIPPKDQFTVVDKIQVMATHLQPGITYWARIINRDLGQAQDLPDRVVAIDPQRTAIFALSPTPTGGYLPLGTYAAEVYRDPGSLNDRQCTSRDFTIGAPNVAPMPAATPCPPNDPKCTSGGGIQVEGCGKNDPRGAGFVTAIGCIHTNPTELIKDFLTFIIGISGGLAFLMMLLGAFQMLTSAGNPETLHAGKDRLTSAVIGLLFIIFSILLLQIIGVDILKIPEFGKQP